MALISLCQFFVNGMPILRIVMGKESNQRALSPRYRDFIGDLQSK